MENDILRIRELPDNVRECILEAEPWKEKGLDIISRGNWENGARTVIFMYNERFWKIEVKKDDRPRYKNEPRYYITDEVQEIFPTEENNSYE